jgi:hypothetical protein
MFAGRKGRNDRAANDVERFKEEIRNFGRRRT